MEQIVKVLHEVAAEGSIPSLLNLLNKDRFILDRCTVISNGETPLHIAVMFGHLEFCKELLSRKPELAEEVDFRRASALHLASAKGFTDIVKVLVSVRPQMSLAYDEEGKTPFHVAAMKGRVQVLKELMDIQPDAAHRRVEMCQGETVLHLCVQYSQLEALRFLVENISDEELLNAKDDNGNSLLHLAVFDKQVQIVKYLVENTKIDVNALNSNGLTALEILGQTRRDSKYIDLAHCLLNHASQISHAISSSPEAKYPSRKYQKLPKSKNEKNDSKLNKSKSKLSKQTTWLEEQRNSLMVVASLIATMGFQSALTPPGGFWQVDTPKNSTTTEIYGAGNSIFADKHEDDYKVFMVGNTIGFISSLSVILLLVSGLPFTRKVYMWTLMAIMWISISALAFTYSYAITAHLLASEKTLDNIGKILGHVILGWVTLTAFLNMIHAILLISHLMRKWNSKLRVFMWILIAITGISVVMLVAPLTEILRASDVSQFMVSLVYMAAVGWLFLLVTCGVVALLRFVHFIAEKLITCCQKMKRAPTSSRNQDNIIVV